MISNQIFNKFGIVQGRVSGNGNVGSVIGTAQIESGTLKFSEVYCKQNLNLTCGSSCGGMIGNVLFTNNASFSISNSYTRSVVSSSSKFFFLHFYFYFFFYFIDLFYFIFYLFLFILFYLF